jgi:hypothetical protein
MSALLYGSGFGMSRASSYIRHAESQGWKRIQTPGGPIKYIDENGIARVEIKRGSVRAPGSGFPHVSLRDAFGQFINPSGKNVIRKGAGNHTPIIWDLP